jgi:hypothetical protein
MSDCVVNESIRLSEEAMLQTNSAPLLNLFLIKDMYRQAYLREERT